MHVTRSIDINMGNKPLFDQLWSKIVIHRNQNIFLPPHFGESLSRYLWKIIKKALNEANAPIFFLNLGALDSERLYLFVCFKVRLFILIDWKRIERIFKENRNFEPPKSKYNRLEIALSLSSICFIFINSR